MPKSNWLSDVVIMADQGTVMGARSHGVEPKVTTLMMHVTDVEFVRVCRDNDVEKVKYNNSLGGYLSGTLEQKDGLTLHIMADVL